MMEWIDTKVIAALLAGLLTYLITSLRLRRELEAEYDLDLRGKRIEAYSKLWKLLQPLAKYAREKPFDLGKANALTKELRIWYFEDGGLLLSGEARDAYFKVQDALTAASQKKSEIAGEDLPDFKKIRKLASALRTALATDVGTRKRGTFRDEADD